MTWMCKMAGHVPSVVVCLVLLFIQNTLSDYQQAHRRFEYKLSFKGPHLVQRDGTIPFWEHGGHAIASDESIRITPSLRSKKGHVWSREKNTHENWEVELVFRISGRGRVGADGLAMWFTEEKGQEGPVFGSSDKWKGLGIFMDSFDNDAQHNNPYILAMLNDGTLNYNHNTDGSNQQMGGCLRDFRNKPFPVRMRVEYYNKALTITVHNGMSQGKTDFELCMRAENVQLPSEGYFGVSAATGGLADDHDVQAFLTHSLKPPADVQQPPEQVPEDERKKFEKEFEEYYDKLQKAKQDYQKEHPDQRGEYDVDDKELYESMDAKDLRQIFEGQNNIHATIRDLHRKLDEVVGRQERTMSQITMLGQQAGTGQVPQPPPGGQPAQLPYVDTIKRHEVDSVLANQRELQQSLRDIRSIIADVQSKTNNMGTGGRSGYDGTAHHNELKNMVNSVQNEVRTLVNRPQVQSTGGCPKVETSCISSFSFFTIVAVQLAFFVGYSLYRSSKEAAAKKFY